MEFFKDNLDLIRKKDDILYEKLLELDIDDKNYTIIETKNRKYTLKVRDYDGIKETVTFLHSKYNPEREAANFAKMQFDKKSRINIIYGFGLGYHIEKILEILDIDDILYVVDLNLEVFKIALKLNNLRHILSDKRLKLIISDDEKWVAKKFKNLLSDENKFVIYPPSIKTIPNKYSYFKFLMEDWNMKKSITGKWVELLRDNFEKNKKIVCENIGVLFNSYKNKPIIIVSAGPSLNKNKHLLKKIKGKAFIFSVGSALKPLLKVGVKPDMFCIIDPSPITYKQIEGFEDLDIPLVFLNTASAYTVSKYKGPKYVAVNRSSEREKPEYLIDMGGSVATAVMDMAIKFGGNPIVFIGQDLAFTNGEHHADGNMYGEEEKVKSLPNMRKIRGQNGEILDTTLGLLSFKYWIENKIKDNPHIEFINATEGGAYIEGCKHMKLQEFIDKYIK
ncbi:motility associated factor glycosyltransferase family protein [Caloranaerobacter azorensis]|uniref:motility associated factor glycosyltransferase family protein n=1 Tax=Caloranaerobacter azorensis TaxID=116090 RepID=UPI0009DF88EF|nr:6-hydroxymethylpterin diphosphokinase MptE-like protein [Caloranaerobacter azorensis]